VTSTETYAKQYYLADLYRTVCKVADRNIADLQRLFAKKQTSTQLNSIDPICEEVYKDIDLYRTTLKFADKYCTYLTSTTKRSAKR
jgi:hypothetical protein